MHIDLSEIIHISGLSVSADWTGKMDISQMCQGEGSDAQVSFTGRFMNEDGRFHLAAEVLLAGTFLCDRCLKPMSESLSFVMDEFFSKEDLKNGVVDLTGTIKSHIAVNMPMKFLCSDQCKGLCATCGQNLNEAACGCFVPYLNPAFSAISSLFHDEEV